MAQTHGSSSIAIETPFPSSSKGKGKATASDTSDATIETADEIFANVMEDVNIWMKHYSGWQHRRGGWQASVDWLFDDHLRRLLAFLRRDKRIDADDLKVVSTSWNTLKACDCDAENADAVLRMKGKAMEAKDSLVAGHRAGSFS